MPWKKTFDLRSMDIFLTVAESESMALAARKLQITQAAVSQSISKIERELGATLIDRSLRPLRLTPAGHVLRDRARHLLDLANETRLAVSGTGPVSVAKLRMAVLNSMAGSLLPHLFDDLSGQMGIDDVTMWSGFSIEHNAALLNREVDVIITTEPMDTVGDLETFELLREPYIVVLPAGSTAPGGELDRLPVERPLLRYSTRNLMGRAVDQHLRRLRISVPRRIEFDSSWSIGRMMASGRGWAIMTPTCLLEANLHPSQVQCFRFPSVPFTRRLYLVARAGELGALPGQIADACRTILDTSVRHEISDFGQWLSREMNIPDVNSRPATPDGGPSGQQQERRS